MTTTSIDDKTLLLALDFSRFGNSRQIGDGDYEVGHGQTDKALTSASAKRLDSAALNAIEAHDSGTRKWLEAKTLPSLLKPGIYRVPVAAYQAIVDGLTERKAEREDLVATFAASYDADVAATKKRLGPVGAKTEYPPAAQAAADFDMRWRFLASGVDPKLAAIDPTGHAQEVAQYKANLTHAADAYVKLLRLACAELVDHLVERLTPKADGKRKRFHAANVLNLREFLADFPARNVADDAELGALVAKADAILAGVDLDDVKDDDLTRAYLLGKLQDVKAGLDPLVKEAKTGQRRIKLEEGGAAA